MALSERLAQAGPACQDAAERLKGLEELGEGTLKASEYATRTLEGERSTPSPDRAREAVASLEKAIREEVTMKRKRLLERLEALQGLRGELGKVREGAEPLRELAARARERVKAPHEKAQERARQLENLSRTAHLMRASARILKLASRATADNLARAAHAASQVEQIFTDSDLKGIRAAEEASNSARAALDRARKEAPGMLRAGAESGSLSDCAAGAQALHSADKQELERCCSTLATERAQSAGVALAAGRWEEAANHLGAVWRVQRALARRRDADGAAPLLEALREKPCGTFVTALCNELRGRASEERYPRLMSGIASMCAKVEKECQAPGLAPAIEEGDERKMQEAISEAEKAYGNGIKRRMIEAADKAAWSSSAGKLVGALREESDIAQAHPKCIDILGRSAKDSLDRFCDRCEAHITPGSESASAAPLPPNQAQQRALSAATALGKCASAFRELAGACDNSETSQSLSDAADRADKVSERLVAPLVKDAEGALEIAVLEMHGSSSAEEEHATTESFLSRHSSHMERLLVAAGEELMPRLPGSIERGKWLAMRLVDVWLRHAALLRASEAEQREAIAKQSERLEELIASNLVPVETLQDRCQWLRGFRKLVREATSNGSVSSCDSLRLVPKVVALHHAYSMAPKELTAPHERAGLSARQYSAWLDQHSDDDAWRGVRGSLEGYANSVKSRGDDPCESYHDILHVGQLLFDANAE